MSTALQPEKAKRFTLKLVEPPSCVIDYSQKEKLKCQFSLVRKVEIKSQKRKLPSVRLQCMMRFSCFIRPEGDGGEEQL